MSVDQFHSGIVAPQGVWWKPAARQERIWVTVAFIWCMILFAAMPFWHLKGGQNPSGVRSKVAAADFQERTNRFVQEYQVGTDQGVPVVQAPPGSDLYLIGRMWSWYPVLKLKKGAEYMLHFTSMDVNHGLSLFPINLNFQVVPGYDYALRIVPNQSGEFRIICNEFCGIGHHTMVGKIIVED